LSCGQGVTHNRARRVASVVAGLADGASGAACSTTRSRVLVVRAAGAPVFSGIALSGIIVLAGAAVRAGGRTCSIRVLAGSAVQA
jgi:hypothetical protein